MNSNGSTARAEITKPELAQIEDALTDPFGVDEVKWLAKVVRNNRALAIAYVDARVVEDRLDDVFGVSGWQDIYTVLPNNSVVCTLRVRIGNDWIEKSDVGSMSEQPDEGDRMKAAFSDALKRAAVKLGIGRYLYRLPHQWCEYDPQKRQLTEQPKLPVWAMPKPKEKCVTPEQWREIYNEICQRNASWQRLLDHFGVSRPRELPAKKFDAALAAARNPPKEWILETRTSANDVAPPKPPAEQPAKAPQSPPVVDAGATQPNAAIRPQPIVEVVKAILDQATGATKPNGTTSAKPGDPPGCVRDKEGVLRDDQGKPVAESGKPKTINAEQWALIKSESSEYGCSIAKLLDKYQVPGRKGSAILEAQLEVMLDDIRRRAEDVLLEAPSYEEETAIP